MAERITLIFLGLLFFGATCERPVDLDFRNQDPKLAVFSKFTNDKILEVEVSRGKSVLDDSPTDYVLNARVDLYEGDTFIERLALAPDRRPPVYLSRDLLPRRNSIYTVVVEAPGFETVTASSKVPTLVPIDALSISEIVIEQGAETDEMVYHYNVSIAFSDPADEKNYYHLKLNQEFINLEPMLADSVGVQTVIFSPLADNNYQVAHLEGGLLLDDVPFEGQSVELNFPLRFSTEGSKYALGNLLVELAAVSEEYFDYFSSLARQQDNPGAPYAEPVFVTSNVTNGLGYFAGYTSSLDTIAIIK